MRKKRYSVEQIVAAVQQHEAGMLLPPSIAYGPGRARQSASTVTTEANLLVG